jgi:GNAT superfamily N-acetyltransferase
MRSADSAGGTDGAGRTGGGGRAGGPGDPGKSDGAATPAVIRVAEHHDIAGLVRLVNHAFQVEATFVTGERTNRAQIEALWTRGSFFVAAIHESGDAAVTSLAGCVYSERREDGRGYIGMLAVDPRRQGRGLGRHLMDAAEQRCLDLGCTEAVITVIHLRTDLMPFYRRRGYTASGTAPYRDVHRMIEPLHFIVMRKPLER